MNFARLNHIFVPATRVERDRIRRSVAGRLGRPIAWFYGALSDEGRIMTVLLLFIGTGSLEIVRTEVYVLWAALCGIMSSSLLVRWLFPLRGVQLDVQAPARVAIGASLRMTLTLKNRGEREHHAIRLRTPFLPWDGSWQGFPERAPTLPAGETLRFEAVARFVHRGHHHLDPFTAVAVVPLGLAVGPPVLSGGCKFVVVPRIAQVTALPLPLGRSYQPGGIAQASNTGEALELMGVRPYRPGDPVRDLHPRTWARLGSPHVREYQQEFFTRLAVVVDNDRETSSERGFEAVISLAAGVVAHLAGGEALIDVLMLGEQVHALTVGRSLGTLDQALDVLACADTAEALSSERIVRQLSPYLERLSTVIVVSQGERADLVERFAAAGVACRVLRVHDDSALLSSLLGRKAPVPLPASEEERVVTVREIESGAGLILG